MENELEFLECPYTSFIMAIRSPVTREKYLQRLGYFLSYVGINDGNIENRCNHLGQKSKADPIWLANNLVRYLYIQRQRAERREISEATLRNYIKPIKLLCEQLEISLPWKRITRGMPKGRRYANGQRPNYIRIWNTFACFVSSRTPQFKWHMTEVIEHKTNVYLDRTYYNRSISGN
jgi:hypothetical protein